MLEYCSRRLYQPAHALRFSAFTLIEVLVAFAIMSLLLSSIIQSQSDSAYVISSTDFRIKVRSHIETRLFEIEGQADTYKEGVQDGKFEEGHMLEGNTWLITVSFINVFQVPLKKISYEVTWDENGVKKSLSAYVFAKGI